MQITYCDMCGKETHWETPGKFSASFRRPDDERDSFSAELCPECTRKLIEIIKANLQIEAKKNERKG